MKNAELSLDEFFTVNNNSEIPLSLYENDLILSFPDSETSTILGMQTIWFVIALVFLILSVAGLVTAAVLCFCRQRAATPRHPHNAHNAQTHPPVSFPCEFRKKRAPHSLAASLPPSSTPSFPVSYAHNQSTMKFSAPFHVLRSETEILSRFRIENSRVSHLLFRGSSLWFAFVFVFFFFSIVCGTKSWVWMRDSLYDE